MSIDLTRKRFIHGRSPEIGEWIRNELGLDPNQCAGFTMRFHPGEAVTAQVDVFLTRDQLAALCVEDAHETSDEPNQ